LIDEEKSSFNVKNLSTDYKERKKYRKKMRIEAGALEKILDE
jgi:hypothetical protein